MHRSDRITASWRAGGGCVSVWGEALIIIRFGNSQVRQRIICVHFHKDIIFPHIRWLPRRRLIRSCSFCASSCFTLALNSQRQSLPSPSSDIPRLRSTKPLSVSHRSFRQYQLNLCLLSREEFSAPWKVSSVFWVNLLHFKPFLASLLSLSCITQMRKTHLRDYCIHDVLLEWDILQCLLANILSYLFNVLSAACFPCFRL